ncbi:collagen-like protein [Spongiivirga citrea]|uniref:Collagen-like protein n=1 Tax=Spongiivirga citrea TaxID=1481457 RepID=A0A6M0CIG8_9FLAO|nr:collagen-like protein [Spongiivirga citrea]NER17695.1 collagen-like protein [Spongiivirga citrea]
MKNVLKTVFALSVILFVSCEGPEGPPGFDGLDGRDGVNGLDGVNVTGQIIEIEGTFNAANDYRIFYEFPQSIEVFETDVVLVYLLFDEVDLTDGSTADLWRLLPQTRIIDQGLLQYNYEHTFIDVDIFLESDFDLSTLPAGDTDNQIFRIAVIPADEISSGRIDPDTLGKTLNSINMEESKIKEITF